jgi:nucleoid-associated protein YgaU
MIMDSLEQEEYFYQNRNNHLYQKEGFYIYYENTAREKKQDMELEIDIPFEKRFREKSNDTKIDLRKNIWIEKEERNTYAGREETPERINRGKYRELLKQQPAKSSGKKVGAYGMAAVVVLLIGIVGTGIYQERIKVSGLEQMIETIAGAVSKSDTQTTEKMETEQVSTEETLQQIQSMETMSDEIIPVENIPGGDIIQDTSAEVHTEAALETIEETPVEVQMMEQQQQMSDIQVEEEVQVVSDPQSYTVQKGDTLIKICQKIYGNTNRLNDIATLNEMENPDNLREGQQIVLPQ